MGTRRRASSAPDPSRGRPLSAARRVPRPHRWVCLESRRPVPPRWGWGLNLWGCRRSDFAGRAVRFVRWWGSGPARLDWYSAGVLAPLDGYGVIDVAGRIYIQVVAVRRSLHEGLPGPFPGLEGVAGRRPILVENDGVQVGHRRSGALRSWVTRKKLASVSRVSVSWSPLPSNSFTSRAPGQEASPSSCAHASKPNPKASGPCKPHARRRASPARITATTNAPNLLSPNWTNATFPKFF